MEGNRIVIDPTHGHRRSRTFALLVVLGLAVVGGVWYFQLRTMVRQARLSEAVEDLAAIEEAMRESFDESRAAVDAAADGVVPDGVVEAIGGEIVEARAKDAVAGEIVEGFAAEAEAEVAAEEAPVPEEEPASE
ncbi:hypothetical protein HYS28_03625 [Candidatus Uhrbacteria bacterium]|nr:hypothetical protein [Candidatus Uhrbacteria bacterium]